jgi:SAM-dependent methyltransferase
VITQRLAKVLQNLPIPPSPQRTLNIGCGEFHEAEFFCQHWAGWLHIGLDWDYLALDNASPAVGRIQANALYLPFACDFSLILIRHPNIPHHPDNWSRILQNIPARLAPRGILLVTAYHLDERDFIHRHVSLPTQSIGPHDLAPLDLVGRDRYLLAYVQYGA